MTVCWRERTKPWPYAEAVDSIVDSVVATGGRLGGVACFYFAASDWAMIGAHHAIGGLSISTATGTRSLFPVPCQASDQFRRKVLWRETVLLGVKGGGGADHACNGQTRLSLRTSGRRILRTLSRWRTAWGRLGSTSQWPQVPCDATHLLGRRVESLNMTG